MWLLLSRRLRAWLLLALGAPALAWILTRLGEHLETRHGPTRTSRALTWAGRKVRRRARGPLAHHQPTHHEHDGPEQSEAPRAPGTTSSTAPTATPTITPATTTATTTRSGHGNGRAS